MLPYDFLTKRIIDALPSSMLVLRLTSSMGKPDYRIQIATNYAIFSLFLSEIQTIFSPSLTQYTIHKAGKRKPHFLILTKLDISFPILQG